MVLSFNLVYSLLSGPGGFPVRSHRQAPGADRGLGCLYALIYLGFARITAGWQAWALMTVYGVYAALFDGVAKAFVADLVPQSLRGTAYGIFHTAVGLAALPASLIAGVLWEGIGPWHGLGTIVPILLRGILAAAASLLLALVITPADVA